jgi:3-oxoacyl-[acyl-carrier-protein] synthase II
MEERTFGLNTVHITDCGCVTCLGDGLERLWQSLLVNTCGFKPVRRFNTDGYVNNLAGCIAELDDIPHGKRFPAILEKVCQGDIQITADAVLLTATTKDNIELHERYIRDSGKEPAKFPVCSMIDYLTKTLGAGKLALNINAACASASSAILWGAEMIGDKETDMVIVFGADIVSEFAFSGFSALKVMSPDIGRPFDVNRNGLILGEAAGYVVLMSETKMLKEKRTSLGKIIGWGISSDAHHITAPDRNGSGLQRAIHSALKKASIRADEIAAINGHGTGTVHNDAMEITAFSKVFGDGMPPIFSIKGAIGHSLGPCGLIEVLVGLRCLQEQIIPPVTGLQDPEPDIEACVTTEKTSMNGNYLLTTNSGFGNINTALILEKV